MTICEIILSFCLRYPQYQFSVDTEAPENGDKVGSVEVWDGDTDDVVSLDLRGDMSEVFRIDDAGEIFIDNIGYMRGKTAHILVTAQVDQHD